MNQRWIVIFNCQSEGLASSIDCLAKQVDCTSCDAWDFKRRIAEDPDYFRQFDFAVVSNEVPGWAGGTPYTLPAHIVLPSFQFCAYHPDLVYVSADGTPFEGLVGEYHSMIALAAYKEGLSPECAATYFNRHIYQVANYFNLWQPFRDALIAQYREAGLDISSIFIRGSRGAPFMHTVNHPKVEVLFDVAKLLLDKLQQPTFSGVEPPPDKLAGLSWPIYPEIGEHFGAPGSYLFKPLGCNKPLELVPYLARSLSVFSGWDRSQLRVVRHLEPFLQRVRAEMQNDR